MGSKTRSSAHATASTPMGSPHPWASTKATLWLWGALKCPRERSITRLGRGPVGEIVAGLFSMEKRPLSLIGYAYYHHTGEYQGLRQSGNVFAGVGTAWTPIDVDESSKIFSVQVGLSHERTFAIEQDGIPLPDSGGSGVFSFLCPSRRRGTPKTIDNAKAAGTPPSRTVEWP